MNSLILLEVLFHFQTALTLASDSLNFSGPSFSPKEASKVKAESRTCMARPQSLAERRLPWAVLLVSG